MSINQSKIRTVVKFSIFAVFIVGVVWRFYNIIKFGGKKDTSEPQVEGDDDSDYGHKDEVEENAPPNGFVSIEMTEAPKSIR